MASSDSNQSLTTQEADELFSSVMRFAPTLDFETCQQIDTVMSGSGQHAVLRRLGLGLATKDGSWFKQVSSDREVAKVVAAQVPDLIDCIAGLREVANLIEGAVMRTEVALCAWADLPQLREEAKSLALLQEAN